MAATGWGLRARLMLTITALLAAILLAATALVIDNARRAVTQEMDATVALTAALLGNSLPADASSRRLLRRLSTVEGLRHLCLRLVTTSRVQGCPHSRRPQAPGWFIALTTPANPPTRRLAVAGSDEAILIQADPADEIAEAWHDVRGLLGLILLFYLITLGVVFYALGRTTTPIQRISAALADVEQGAFDRRLPAFTLPEFDRIARHFNVMAETLERARAENQRLHRHALRVQETERAHLARELHDELGQNLTAIRADAAGILAYADQLPGPAQESARAIVEVAGQVYDQSRAMMRRLRPPGLDELGLTAALEENLAGWRRQQPGIHHRLDVDPTLERLEAEFAIHVFRIVQESLTNIHRHAHATLVTIDLSMTGETVQVRVVDNGRGFDPESTPPGLGLSGMRERAELLGGRLTVISEPASGTRLQAMLPLPPAGNKSGSFPIAAAGDAKEDAASG